MEQIQTIKKYLGQIVTVTIDRPLGSAHPRHGYTYPINYGFVPGTISGDGKEVDAYVLGVSEPLTTFTGTCIAIIHRTNDDDDKLILVPEQATIDEQAIRQQTYFQEQFFSSEIWLA